MKKKSFNYYNKKVIINIGKFLLGMIIALIMAYIIYPKFALTKIDTQVQIEDKVGGYTYYKVVGWKDTFNKRVDNPEEKIGDIVTTQMRVKSHPKYEDDNKVGGMGLLNFIYFAFVIAISVCVYKLYKDENTLSYGGLGYSIIALPSQTIWMYLLVS